MHVIFPTFFDTFITYYTSKIHHSTLANVVKKCGWSVTCEFTGKKMLKSTLIFELDIHKTIGQVYLQNPVPAVDLRLN